MPIRIAVDAMGGDYAPLEIVKGAVQAAREYEIAIQLVGNEVQIKEELAKYDTQFKKQLISEGEYKTAHDRLDPKIAEGHDYKFVGKVGNFCPIIPGKGGGELVRDQNGKFYNVAGSSGYRWLESELVRGVNEEFIDRSYYDALVDAAVETISQYGDFEMFASDDPYMQ